jgi:2-polyprenyl-3-methyl-5-hydroxy-6-metoxy-1,4-benzoquinol methylase
MVAKEHLDYVLVGDALEQLQHLPNNSFDLFICNDVIEHIAEPEILFQKIRIKMKLESRIVCSIPNIRVLDSLIHIIINKDFEYTYWGIRDKTHLRFYTKRSMLRLFQRNGFKIEKIAGINPIKTFKTSILLWFLQMIGHGDIRYPQYGIVARF